MNRCDSPPRSRAARRALLGALAAYLGLAGSLAVSAQSFKRPFPAHALRGTLVVVSPTEVTINGQPERLSPGSRIRSTQNLLLMSGSLLGQELVVNYTRESLGLIHEVWILTPDEAREKRASKPAS